MLGARQDREEAVHHAVDMINKYSMSVEDIAEMLGVAAGWLYNRVASELCRQDLVAAGVRAERLNHSQLQQINSLKLDKPKAELAKLTVQYKVGSEDVRKLASQVKQKTSERDQMSVLRQERQTLASSAEAEKNAKGSSVRKPLRTQFFRFLNALGGFILKGHRGKPFTGIKQLQLTTKADRDSARRTWRELREAIDAILEE